jgi:CheY-like chemotaxis protein
MILYIVEDNLIKIEKIQGFLTSRIPEIKKINYFYSFNSGLKAVKENPPNLILLDMTLPTFDRRPNSREGRSRPLGGYDIMRKMKLFGIKSRVIVVTQLESFGEGSEMVGFKDLTILCKKEFGDFFLGSVYFNQSDSAWMEDLYKLLKTAMESNYD